MATITFPSVDFQAEKSYCCFVSHGVLIIPQWKSHSVLQKQDLSFKGTDLPVKELSGEQRTQGLQYFSPQ